MKWILTFLVWSSLCLTVFGQEVPSNEINPSLLNRPWSARWISHPTASPVEYGVYHFRKSFDLADVPGKFIVNISGDNRYRFFVNGTPVCEGPARGDIEHWRFESVDIAPYLRKGKNVLAAEVWNFALRRPVAQFSLMTGFIVQGNSSKEEMVNTNSSWKVMKDKAYSPGEDPGRLLHAYIVVGPPDVVDGSKYPWGWENIDYDDSAWKQVSQMNNGQPKGIGTETSWTLTPREIPFMEKKQERMKSVRRSEGISVPDNWLQGKAPLTIPANHKVSILIDNGVLTTAYPQLFVTKGKGATIKVSYAEALVDENGQKGNRDDIKGKKLLGYTDVFLPDGGTNRMFRSLWFRTYRYIRMDIQTGDEPLTIDDYYGMFTAYPLVEKAAFASSDSTLKQIWNVGWRTARLCANETYFDCPYYEQLQYVGDTRIQALISLYVSGDDRLMRKAIQLFNDSRFSEGLTRSRYPSYLPQIIPPYSLFWVDMVNDYRMLRDDSTFVKSNLWGIENVMHWFEQRIDPKTGLLGKVEYWNFVDWAEEWGWSRESQMGGMPAGGFHGQSAMLTLQFAYSAQHAAEIFKQFNDTCLSQKYQKLADNLVKAVRQNCWDESRGYFADTPEKKEFSMHTNIFAVLTGAIEKGDANGFIRKMTNDTSLIQPTMYFRFYLTQAMKKAGLADKYLNTLGLWRDMLAKGLTTFAEKPDPTRSDCHAWSASPDYDLLATVAGIEPASPGFQTVKIEPALGPLQFVKGKFPHPDGMIEFDLHRKGKVGITGQIVLPANLTGVFRWNGKEVRLHSGSQEINL
ncbi:alpha-L-rhamnosidase C-terminal domain-containing protein [Prolixibacter denitrificans]|uniref:Alpha-L-rhamnosidase-like protein n=1 Tax=Prolixibacter denitrificans TaxID=1541063 RepID=A0A2P8CBV7_9BACT|nr:alpha-L-rhamnosidase C-terminal domain-containing protein [Prolixibacter denitrificans]PSK82449.1 alpha-L-rhamnosidase-like protein [Prolixibacter denitrificans]GET22809.1 hypothetical protein JCM18694_30550 [Prolixibacter denitrificans]